MKPNQIEAGKTYINRGKGTTKRTVLAISDEHIPMTYYGPNRPVGEPGVLYKRVYPNGDYCVEKLYLSSFATWAGKEVDG